MRFVEITNVAGYPYFMRELLADSGTIALDCETDSKDPRKATLLKVVVANSEVAYSVPAKFLHSLELHRVPTLILQHFKYDFTVLYRNGVDLSKNRFFDTEILHHLIDENSEHNLDFMVKRYFGDDYKEVFWSTYKEYIDAPADRQLEYECKDGIYTYRLFELFWQQLTNSYPVVYQQHEVARELYFTERDGVSLDTNLIIETAPKMKEQIEVTRDSLRPLVSNWCDLWELKKWGEEIEKRKTPKGKAGVTKPVFNFDSPTQIKWLLYDALGLPVLKKTKARQPATDYDTLNLLSKEFDEPVLGKLIEYSGLGTLYNTFVVGLLERAEDGIIYPTLNVNGTKTGRISHSNPNLGNMPKTGIYRSFFIPKIGKIIGADYSQLEVIIEANLTNDPNLIKIILEGASKHDITAQALGIDRETAKLINFAMQYWCGPDKVAKLLKISRAEGKSVYEKYWLTYSGSRKLKDITDKEVESSLQVTNLVGRTRHFPQATNHYELERFQRQAYNFKIQGPGGHFTNMAFAGWSRSLREMHRGRALWTVHDEVLGDVQCDYVEEEMHNLVSIMRQVGENYMLKYSLGAKAYGPLDCWAKT